MAEAKQGGKIPSQSKYFSFGELSRRQGRATVAEHLGWNGLSVARLEMSQGALLGPYHSGSPGRENIIVVTKGALELKLEQYQAALGQYDAVNFTSNLPGYQLSCSEAATAFLISVGGVKPEAARPPVIFNFEKDLEARDLWGSQCISRPYEGGSLTLVLFDLKPGFTFEDKGHANEQITWLTNGSMAFYANGEHRTMTTEVGVDIGDHHVHGGVSDGAVGFDAFYPKKQEAKYTREGLK